MKKREMSPPQAGAANTTIIPTASLSIQTGKGGAASIAETETDTEIAPLIQQIGAASIAEIDRLIAELQEAKSYLLSEGQRIEKEMVRYANLTQMALASAKIIFDAVSQWHPARKQQNASEVTAASTDNGSQWDTSELSQETDATEGTPTHAKV